MGSIVASKNHTIYFKFLCEIDWPKDNITLQEGETVAYKWVSKDELRSMSKSELVTKRMQQFMEELR